MHKSPAGTYLEASELLNTHPFCHVVKQHKCNTQSKFMTFSCSVLMFYFWPCCSQEFHHLIDDNIELLVKLRDLIIDWVQEGFQDFFQKLDGHFHVLSGRSKKKSQESTMDSVQIDKVPTVLVLMLAQLCVYIEQTTVPKVTEVRCVVSNHLATVQCEAS